MDQTTTALAHFVSTIRLDSLSPQLIHETRRRVLDGIACAAGAFHYPLSETLRRLAATHGADAPARVWFTGAPSSADLAGLANGTMLRYLDLSDTILSRAAGHPSDMIPALVALAEVENAPGDAVLEGIVAAYAVYGGLCDAVAFQKRAVDQSTAAALGAAAGASRILGLDPQATGQALSLALGANVSLYNIRQGALSDWKALAGPNGARNGVFAARLAQAGLTGPSGVFDGTSGFKEIVGDFDLPGALRPDRLVDTHLKAYPVCYHGQSAADATMALTGAAIPDDIRCVQVETYDVAFRMMANDPIRWAPPNRETADHSIPFVVGTILATGHLRADAYDDARLDDPALRRFLSRIEVRPEDSFSARYPAETRTRITLHLADGTSRVAETVQPKGHVANPMTDADLLAKLDSLWPAKFGAAHRARVVEAVWSLGAATSARQLVDALCAT